MTRLMAVNPATVAIALCSDIGSDYPIMKVLGREPLAAKTLMRGRYCGRGVFVVFIFCILGTGLGILQGFQ